MSAVSEWRYVDDNGAQKGPISASVLKRLLLRNMGLLSRVTLVWKPGMDSWLQLGTVPEWKELVNCVYGQWHYGQTAKSSSGDVQSTQGPVTFQKLGGLMREGQVTASTFVWCPEVTEEWKAAADIDTLRDYLEDIRSASLPLDTLDGDVGVVRKGAGEKVTKDTPAATLDGTGVPREEGIQQLLELATQQPTRESGNSTVTGGTVHGSNDTEGPNTRKRKRKKGTWAKTSTWVYVQGLPADITQDELQSHFSKCGVIALDPRTGGPKIKIYRDEHGEVKGDAAVCYASEDSVSLAVQILDGGCIRYGMTIKVSVATFEKKENFEDRKPKLSSAQLKIAKAAAKQKLAWNEVDDTGLAMKALRIVVISNLFDPIEFEQKENFGEEIEQSLVARCDEMGPIDKMTVFSKNPKGVVVVKFVTAYAAEECIRLLDNQIFRDRKLRVQYWDGITDYTVVDTEQEEKRDEDFGTWLNEQSLPEDLVPQTEEGPAVASDGGV